MAIEKKNWSIDQIEAVWIKTIGQTQEGKDSAGAIISFSQYGNTSTELNKGWEIDHIKPRSHGGSDSINNLRALHWENNRSKGDDYPRYTTVVSSENGRNTKKRISWIIK